MIRPPRFLRERAAVIAAIRHYRSANRSSSRRCGGALTAALEKRGRDAQTPRAATDAGMAIRRLAAARWTADEHADHTRLLGDRAADLLAVLNAGGAVRT